MSYPRDLDEYSEYELITELKERALKRNSGRCDYCNRHLGDGDPCKFPERHRMASSLEECLS